MRQPRTSPLVAVALVAGGLLVVQPVPAGAAPELGGAIHRGMKKLADKMHGRSASRTDTSDPSKACHWVTQSITHQGVTHTRRAQICEKHSWWADWIAKAKRRLRG